MKSVKCTCTQCTWQAKKVQMCALFCSCQHKNADHVPALHMAKFNFFSNDIFNNKNCYNYCDQTLG